MGAVYTPGADGRAVPGETVLEGSALYGSFTATYQLTDSQIDYSNRTSPITATTRVIGDPAYIVANRATGSTGQNNQVSTNDYYFGIDDFNGKYIYIDQDLDFGATQTAGGLWDTSSPLYMPVAGQYSMLPGMEKTNGYAKLGASFNGKLDGQGHSFTNLYCERYANSEYGDSQSIGIIGRLGVHDNDPQSRYATDPTVRNIVLESGYISGRRSVGGFVGKIGQTTASVTHPYNGDKEIGVGGTIEFCINKASVRNTDAKGIGGICGAPWNGGLIQYCANFGDIISTYRDPAGGIAGYNEVVIKNCYSVGDVRAAQDRFAMGIGTNNGGAPQVSNCYWLSGSAPGGGYYNNSLTDTTFGSVEFGGSTGITLTAALLNATNKQGGYWVDDTTGINSYNGVNYPTLVFPVVLPYEPGDYDGNGSVSILDVMYILTATSGAEVPTNLQLLACDLSGDGSLSILDVSMALNLATGGA
jgi:hypothetical protein